LATQVSEPLWLMKTNRVFVVECSCTSKPILPTKSFLHDKVELATA
jgi:hypothetical protein